MHYLYACWSMIKFLVTFPWRQTESFSSHAIVRSHQWRATLQHLHHIFELSSVASHLGYYLGVEGVRRVGYRSLPCLSSIVHLWSSIAIMAKVASLLFTAELWTLTQLQVAAKTTDIHMAFGGKTNHGLQHRPQLQQGLRPRCGPQQQQGLGHHHGLRWQLRPLPSI